MKRESGITLIALVITIIVLLILAGISINILLGDNGIIEKAKQAQKETKIAIIKEEIRIKDSKRRNGRIAKRNTNNRNSNRRYIK